MIGVGEPCPVSQFFLECASQLRKSMENLRAASTALLSISPPQLSVGDFSLLVLPTHLCGRVTLWGKSSSKYCLHHQSDDEGSLHLSDSLL
jgi:hypothetical protein